MFLIGEIGINWDGSFEILEEMMKNCKKNECSAIKLQAFSENLVKKHPENKRLMKSSVSPDNIEKINDIANKIGIEWFCTPMYNEAVDFLEPFVKRYKIREYDGRSVLQNKNSELIDSILKTEKEIIVSVNESPINSSYYNNPKIKWLYCVPKYPAEISEHNFNNFADFNGLSNHCTHFLVPLMASILNAEILEIHVTLDKTKNFIDNNVSYDFKELEQLVNLIKLSSKMISREN